MSDSIRTDTSETRVEVRLLNPVDTERARALFVAGMMSMASLLPNETARRDLEGYVQSVLAGDLADPNSYYVDSGLKSGFWVATLGDLVVGTAAAYPASGEPGVVEVFRVSVDARHRRLGIAGALMDTLEEWASGVGYEETMLRTTEYLKAAQKFYESRCYRLVNTERHGEFEIRQYRKRLR